MNFYRLSQFVSRGQQYKLCKYHQRFFSVQTSIAQNNTSEKYVPGEEIHGYSVQKIQEIPELYLTAIRLQHIKTGAQHVHINRKDNNNVFSVSFRTTPMDDTGVPHILEHTTLCGSEKYPVRDPFFKMLNRSLATFMNAFTSNDWTMYPFSTQNKQDYQNLMSVYLDAVFHPQLRELDFSQEGWRLEHADVQDSKSPLIFKGVVYNEMKGVFSNSRNLYAQVAQNKLLPSHTYGVCYGGDPASIPQLTWEQLKHFHATHYHPSNSRFFTYGNFPLEDHLKFINENYLQNFSAFQTDTKVPPETRWSEPKTEQMSCQPDPMAPDKDKQTTITVNYLLSPITDNFEAFTQKIIGTLLVDGEMAPFYQSLIESQIGSDYSPVNGYSDDTFEGVFSVGLEGIHPDRTGEVEQLIEQTFDKVIKEGFDEKRIEAILHKIELSLKHQSSNFGLGLSLAIATSWNHDGDPVTALRINNHVNTFRKCLKEEPQFLQNKVRQYFKNNKHKLTLIMSPDENFEMKRQEAEKKRLEEIISAVREPEREKIFKRGIELLEKQMATEDLSCLPTLKVEDIDRKINKEPFKTIAHDGINIQYSEQPTNEVSYLRMLTDADQIPPELRSYIPLFTEVITRMGAGELDYKQQSQEIDLCSGGLGSGVHLSLHANSIGVLEQGIMFSSHCLHRNFQRMLDLWIEIFNRPHLKDHDRLTTLVKMSAASLASSIADCGHFLAISHSASTLNPASQLHELYSGMTQVSIMKKLAESSDVSEIIGYLQDISKIVMNKDNLRVCVNATPTSMPKSLRMIESFINSLPGNSKEREFYKQATMPDAAEFKTQFELPFSVNYMGSSFSTVPYSHEDYARLRVLSRLMSTKYLHREIREKGGAYGGGATCQPGSFSFYSYRDPNNLETLEVFKNSVDWAAHGSFTDGDIDEAKLGVFQQIDKPVTPGSIGVIHFLTGVSDEERQTARDRLFAVGRKDLIDVAQRYLSSEWNGVSFLGPSNDSLKSNSSWKIIRE